MQTGYVLRHLFATILHHCNPTSPANLWNDFKHHICDDLLYKLQHIYPNRDFTQDEVYDYGLYLVDDILRKWSTELANIADMPHIVGDWTIVVNGNRLLNEQFNYNREELAQRVTTNVELFNHAQREVYNAVMDSINNNNPKLFFLHSAGGCGKTFVCNTIAAAVRAQGKIALCVASSGIASLLLEGGRTAHSTFHIPLQINDTSVCNITHRSHLYPVLQQTAIIIWDEVPMQHKYAIEAVDRTIQDLLSNNNPFGGITVLFGGDFRQTLPVIPHGSRQQVVAASLKRSSLWDQVNMHYLFQNMCLEQTSEIGRAHV